MKLAISNLAFNNFDEIKDLNIPLLECVFSKIQPILCQTNSSINEWKENLSINIKPYSVQSITYGCGLINFEASPSNLNVIDKIINLSRTLNLERLIFGSPTLRKGKPDLSMFKYIDERLFGSNMIFCIEPNSRIYGGEYFFDIDEISIFLKKHKFKNIYTMVDTHNSWLEQKCPSKDIYKHQDIICHVHASEIKLNGLTSLDKHKEFACMLNKINYSQVITYESNNLNGINNFTDIYK